MPLDVLLIPLLPSSEAGLVEARCDRLSSLLLSNGKLYFPQLLYKIFTDRNRLQRNTLPFHISILKGVFVQELKPGSQDLFAFVLRNDLDAGYGQMESFFQIDSRERQLEVLCTLLGPKMAFNPDRDSLELEDEGELN